MHCVQWYLQTLHNTAVTFICIHALFHTVPPPIIRPKFLSHFFPLFLNPNFSYPEQHLHLTPFTHHSYISGGTKLILRTSSKTNIKTSQYSQLHFSEYYTLNTISKAQYSDTTFVHNTMLKTPCLKHNIHDTIFVTSIFVTSMFITKYS